MVDENIIISKFVIFVAYEKIALLSNVGSFFVHDIRSTSQKGLDIGLPVDGTNSFQKDFKHLNKEIFKD